MWVKSERGGIKTGLETGKHFGVPILWGWCEKASKSFCVCIFSVLPPRFPPVFFASFRRCLSNSYNFVLFLRYSSPIKMINFSDFLKSLTIFHHLKRPSDPLLTQHLYDLQLLCRQSTKYSHFYDIRSCPSSLKTIIIMIHFCQSIFTTSSWQVPRSFWAILTSGDNPRAN